MNRKNIFLLLIMSFLILNLSACTNTIYSVPEKESVVNDGSQFKEPIKEIPIKITSFEAFGNTYTSTKELSNELIGSEIYDDQTSNPYTKGEYKELDFANDLLYKYVNQDESIYSSLISFNSNTSSEIIPITESEKEDLRKNLQSLRSQMELADGSEMILRLDKVTYLGKNDKSNSGALFKIRVAISSVGAYVVPWAYFNVTIFEDGNKLLAHLQ